MEEWPFRCVALAGFFTIAFLAWLTGQRSRPNWKTIVGSIALAWGLGLMTFWLPGSRWVLGHVNDIVVAMLTASQQGSVFLFGPLALGPGEALPNGTASVGFILAMQALPAVVFFAALMAGLYYVGVMQAVVHVFARLFYRSMGLSGAESLSGAANIFVGIEAGLIVQPYLAAMTRSELLLVLTCMMATVASTVMGIYVAALQHVVPQIAGHLISASVISIPCAVLISKLSVPEDEVPVTLGGIPSHSDASTQSPNLIVALIDGAGQGVKMAVGIGALLIVFLGLEALAGSGAPAAAGDERYAAVRDTSVQLAYMAVLGAARSPPGGMADRRRSAWLPVCRNRSGRLFQVSDRAIGHSSGIVAALPHGADLCVVRLRPFASMGIFVGGLTALVPGRGKGCIVTGIARVVDCVPGDDAHRLYRRRSRRLRQASEARCLIMIRRPERTLTWLVADRSRSRIRTYHKLWQPMNVTPNMRKRVEAQGFLGLDDRTVDQINYWLRRSPAICMAGVAIGTAVCNSK